MRTYISEPYWYTKFIFAVIIGVLSTFIYVFIQKPTVASLLAILVVLCLLGLLWRWIEL